MDQDQPIQKRAVQRPESVPGDSISGTSVPAGWRAHMRAITLARQAAGRRYARPIAQADQDE